MNETHGEFAVGSITGQLLLALKDRGARTVFGIPGDYALPMFDVMERGSILPLVTMSHEPALSYAADAAARVGGGIGVAAVTYGAGALNLINGVAAAYAERSPLAVISAAPDGKSVRSELGVHHQLRGIDSQSHLFREITCAQAILDDPRSAPLSIAQTLKECVQQSLPVYFEIPRDMAQAQCGRAEKLPADPSDPETVAECAAEIAHMVRQAKRPVLMIGVEVRRYGLEAEVAELARRAGLPVVTSFMGRGVAATQAMNYAGCYLGFAGDPEISELVEQSDALILFGVILCDTNLGLAARRLDMRRVVHAFGRKVRVANHYYPNVALKDLVAALFAHAPKEDRSSAPGVRARADIGKAAPFTADDQPIRPSDISAAINVLFSSHNVMPVACDVGDSLFVSLEIEHADLVAQGYYASMGFAVPAALGIQAATAQRPLVLVGDGAFQMTGWELGNCQRYGFDPIVVVLNNCSWEMLRSFSPQSRYNDLSDWHFAEHANGLGGEGIRVSTRRGLLEALEAAWRASGRFQLVEIMLERGAVSKTLDRFVTALKR